MSLPYEALLREMEILEARLADVTQQIEAAVAHREGSPMSQSVDSDIDQLYVYEDSDSEATVDESPVLYRVAGNRAQFDPDVLGVAGEPMGDDDTVLLIADDPDYYVGPVQLNFDPGYDGDADDETVVLEDLHSFTRARVLDSGECSDSETVVEDYVDGEEFANRLINDLLDTD